jgi:hypothetical protein
VRSDLHINSIDIKNFLYVMSLDVLAKKGTYFIIRIRLKNRRSVRCSDDG